MENLKALTNEALNVRLRETLVLEREAVVVFLTFLDEYDERRAYEIAGYSSLFTYLVEELHLSEPAAAKRVAAVRLMRKWPAIKERLRSGSIHLTSLHLVGKHLTDGNREAVLHACHRQSKRWVEDYLMREFQNGAISSGKRDVVRPIILPLPSLEGAAAGKTTTTAALPLSANLIAGETAVPSASEALRNSKPSDLPKRVRISTDLESQVLADLKRAKELLGASDFGEVIGKALKHYLKKVDPTRKKPRPVKAKAPNAAKKTKPPSSPPKPSRYVPVQIKTQVHLRDKGQCTYVSPHGRRCSATTRLEIEHRLPFAKGGSHSLQNIELHCPTHNRMKARQVFGNAFIREKIVLAKKGADGQSVRCGALTPGSGKARFCQRASSWSEH